ncbi:MAG: hypothetical protein MJ211_12100 [Bacteroidales bacterium]|nr:hypothetical protein [Bacteroidales bacterium]
MKHIKYISIVLLFIILACNKEENIIYINSDTITVKKPSVLLIIDENGIGDIFYYDRIFKATIETCQKNNIVLYTDFLNEFNNAELNFEILNNYTKYLLTKSSKLLVIIANSKYENYLKKLDLSHKNDSVEYLFLESRTKIDKIHTLYLPMYGASYLSGKISYLNFNNYAVVVMANEINNELNDIYSGFYDGFTTNEMQATCDKLVLSKDGSGFNMADSVYRLYFERIFNYYVCLPACGNTVQGILRGNRDYNLDVKIIGMDIDMTPYDKNIPFSIVKNVDLAIKDFINDWYSNKNLPQHLNLGLESGYVDVVWSKNGVVSEEIFNECITKYKEEAILKENDYENCYK